MERFSRSIVVILSIVLVGASIVAYIWKLPSPPRAQGLLVYVSFYPLADAVSKVGGNHVSVRTMLPPGSEAHDYEPTVRELAKLSTADLFLYNGAHFEPWVDKWAKGSFDRPRYTLDMADEMARRGAKFIYVNGSMDPHMWMSPMLFAREVEIVRDALADIDPAHATDYVVNAEHFIKDLNTLDHEFREGLRSCDKHEVIVSHDAFRYLAHEYGFSLIPIAGISPDEEPSPRALATIAESAKKKGLSYVFFETMVSPKLAQTIAREIGAETLVLNPIENQTLDEVQLGGDYISMMHMNLNNLRKAMICR